MRKKDKDAPVGFVEFLLNKNNSIYLKNASYALGKAAAIAESTGDTETLLNIAGAWLEIEKTQFKKSAMKGKKKPPLGFTASNDFDRMSSLAEEDEDE